MDDDDDWGLSLEELDSIERNAAAQIAGRSKSTTTSTSTSTSYTSGEQSGVGAGAGAATMKAAARGGGWGTTGASPVKKVGGELRVRIFKDEPGRIAVESPYHPDLVAAYRIPSGKRWEASRKVWTYPESELDAAVKAIMAVMHLPVNIDVEPPLAASGARTLNGQGPEKNGPTWDNVDTWSKSSQPLTTAHDNHSGSPPLHHPAAIEANDWRCPKDSKAQFSQSQSQLSQNSGSKQKSCTATLLLHSSGKIAAKFDYDQEMIAACRKVPRVEWYGKERLWMFPFSSLPEAEKIMSNVNNRSVNVQSLVPLVTRALEATAALPDLQERYDQIPEALKNTLMDFQADGVRFSLQHGGRVLIADEMGLGKTLQALAVVSCFQDDWPVLVIVPSSLRLNWATMLVKWLQIHPTDITIVMSQGSCREGFNIIRTTGKQEVALDGIFNIVSYDVLTKLERAILAADFRVVIADESHYMKNPNAKRTNACVPMLQKAKYALLLTGTPALSRPIEMFKQLEALQPTVYKRMEEYGSRYCMGGFFGVWQGCSNHEELHALVKSTVMIRRLKKDVMMQLPKKRREQVFVSLDDNSLRKLKELQKQLDHAREEHRLAASMKDKEEAENWNFRERQILSKIYTDSAEAKLPAVQDYLTTILEGDCKFLVFGHHQSMLDGIQELLEKKKVRFIRIDGKTAASSRLDLVRSFQEQRDVRVALLGIRAAGVGLTLTAASTVIFAEMSWTPGDLVQAEDRVHRIGQESAVNIYYLHAYGSIDDLIWDAVQHKLENLGQVLDGQGEGSMKVGSAAKEVQETLDPFLKPCANTNTNTKSQSDKEVAAWQSDLSEITASSPVPPAHANLKTFLRPFEMGSEGVPTSAADEMAMGTATTAPLDNEQWIRKRAVDGSIKAAENIDLEDDITEVLPAKFEPNRHAILDPSRWKSASDGKYRRLF